MSKQTNNTTNPPWGDFPPYGFMDSDSMAVIHVRKKPDGWLDDLNSYENWLTATLKMIQELIWPVFDRRTMTWQGSARRWMKDLTLFDLGVLRKLYDSRPEAIRLPITAPIGKLPARTHYDLFEDEDLLVSHWGRAYRYYDAKGDADEVNDFVAIIGDAYHKKVGNSVLRLKYALQRPRPYQMAMILGYDDFTYYEALSAQTPSMICGHCAQALLLVGAIMERLILSGKTLPQERWDALEQFAVDVGDRRVMARVHYPSDALASWLMVITMADHVFATSEVKDHLRHAIKERSSIYKLIKESGGLYREGVEAFEQI